VSFCSRSRGQSAGCFPFAGFRAQSFAAEADFCSRSLLRFPAFEKERAGSRPVSCFKRRWSSPAEQLFYRRPDLLGGAPLCRSAFSFFSRICLVYFWSPVPLGLVRSARFARSLWSAPAQLMVAYVLRFFWACAGVNIVLRFCALGGRFVEPSYQTFESYSFWLCSYSGFFVIYNKCLMKYV
jgi:hypothetical protein